MRATRNPVLRLAIPPGHVGGTFVETPGRIGPWQAANGDLYFIMEPAETSNVFMMMKSTDKGATWREVDGANRPKTKDLESVDARQVGDTIHILHQVTQSSRYHTFRTSDHPTQPDSWAVRDELAATAKSVAQAATLARCAPTEAWSPSTLVRPIHYNIRSPAGTWGDARPSSTPIAPSLAGPQAVLGANDTVHLAYYGTDGTIWYRQLLPDGTLTARQQLATGAGTTRAEYGAVLPLVYIPETNTVVIIYRLDRGKLWERRVANDGPTDGRGAGDGPRRGPRTRSIRSSRAPTRSCDGRTVHVLFIEQSSRSIFSTHDKRRLAALEAPGRQDPRFVGPRKRVYPSGRREGLRLHL